MLRTRVLASVVGLTLAFTALAPAAGRLGAIHDYALPSPDAHPTGIVVGSDGAVWFAELASSAIGRRAPDGSFTSYPVTPRGYPNAMVRGPDGAIWFTDYDNDRIGRITTAGQLTSFDAGACGGCLGLWGIAVGADGALWFTEQDAGRIGRITTSGAVTHFALPAGARDPFAITAGPDGALWYSDEAGIGRITTSGVVSQPWTGSGYANGIATGPDGNVWFTLGASDAVARLDLATHRVRLFGLGSNCDPQDIAAGGGALWFGCYFSDLVYRVTTSGALTAFSVPNHFGGTYPDTVSGMTAGAKAMWFTEEAAGRVGKIRSQ